MPYDFAADSFHIKKLCRRLPSSEGLPISVNWTFFARCYGWLATSDYWFKIGDFAPTGAGWPKISGRRGRPNQPFFFSED